MHFGSAQERVQTATCGELTSNRNERSPGENSSDTEVPGHSMMPGSSG